MWDEQNCSSFEMVAGGLDPGFPRSIVRCSTAAPPRLCTNIQNVVLCVINHNCCVCLSATVDSSDLQSQRFAYGTLVAQCCHQAASKTTAIAIKTVMASMEGEEGNNVSEKSNQVQANKSEQTIVIALDASDQAESAVKCKIMTILRAPWHSKLPGLFTNPLNVIFCGINDLAAVTVRADGGAETTLVAIRNVNCV